MRPSPYTYPGIVRSQTHNNGLHRMPQEAHVTINPERQYMLINPKLADEMELKPGDRVQFLELSESSWFMVKTSNSKDSYKLRLTGVGRKTLSLEPVKIIRKIIEQRGIEKSKKIKVQKIKTEIDGKNLFEIKFHGNLGREIRK